MLGLKDWVIDYTFLFGVPVLLLFGTRVGEPVAGLGTDLAHSYSDRHDERT